MTVLSARRTLKWFEWKLGSDGRSTNVADYIGPEMRADWAANREELIAFWQSNSYTTWDAFPDALPWLFVHGSADPLPWTAAHLTE